MEEFRKERRVVEQCLMHGEYPEGMSKSEKANLRRKCRNNYKLEDGVLHYRKNVTSDDKKGRFVARLRNIRRGEGAHS